ncbi:MAG: hypothetical protein ACOYXO_12340 [Chloroflexota bacterium]
MTPSARPLLYSIQVKGQLDDRWLSWFDGLTLTQLTDREVTLICGLLDQSGLHGVLNRIFDLGIELIAVQSLPDPNDSTTERKEQ